MSHLGVGTLHYIPAHLNDSLPLRNVSKIVSRASPPESDI